MKLQKALFAAIILSFSTVTYASYTFFDDFEDGNANGWFETATGSGTTGVVDNNGSLRTYAYTPGGYRSLSRDFVYADDLILSFEMQVIANPGTQSSMSGNFLRHASGGAKVSFKNAFNALLGDSVYFIHSSDGLMPPAYTGVFLDETLNFFSAPFTDYAAIAGLDGSSNIAKFTLEFFANSPGGNITPANASTWFDNVRVAPIPIPGAVWLFGTGLVGLLSRKHFVNR